MIDALLFAVRDAVLTCGQGYDKRTCDVRDDGHPVPRCGDVYVAVHQGRSTSTADNCLDERLGFSLTLTLRVTIPPDRVGDRTLAIKLANSTGFNRRAERLRAFFHQNWSVLGAANNYLVELNPDAQTIYGFCEPARYRGMEIPLLVGGDWFGADPGAEDTGLKAEMRFEDARRLQAIGSYL
jgi:hypothetical protein